MAEYSVLSDYITVAAISELHQVWLVQHTGTKKFYVRKDLTVYSSGVYHYLAGHPVAGVPRIYAVQETDDGCSVIEDYIPGETLQEKIDAGHLRLEEIPALMSKLCNILTQLHSAEPPLVHRDIKPSNVMVTPDGNMVLLDFNAARQFTPGDRDTVLLGTQGYAAPEQYGFGSSTPQTDLYAAGILLRELINAAGDTVPSLDAIVTRCTRLEPGERFATAEELKKAIKSVKLADDPDAAPHRLGRYALPGFRSRTPWKMFVGAAGYCMILLVTFRFQATAIQTAVQLWFERFFVLLFQLSFVAGTYNYLGIQRIFPICHSKSGFARFCGVLLLDLALGTFIILVMILLENIFFPV